MSIQIIVPTINLWEKYTKRALDSIMVAMVRAKSHGVATRLLLIDNASTDNTKYEAGKMVSSLFSHKRNEERWGFQKSVNFGVNDAFERGYDFVLVCNNDIVIHPEAIWRLHERLMKGDAGMVTCMDVRGQMQQEGIAPDHIGDLNPKDKEGVEEAPHPNFSAFALTKECWEEVGEFDEIFAPAYFEDNDYHYRMGLCGVSSIVLPPAMFFHFGSGTQNEANENGLPMVPGGMFENNRASYARKWGGIPGQEKFSHPFNDETKDVRVVEQPVSTPESC